MIRPKVNWTSVAEATTLKTKHDFHRHTLRATLELITELKSSDSLDRNELATNLGNCIAVGGILFERCIQKLNDLVDFDKTCASLAAECFHGILVYVIQKQDHCFVKFTEETSEC